MRHLRILAVIGAVFAVVVAVTVAIGTASRQPESKAQPLPPAVPTTSSTLAPGTPDAPPAPSPEHISSTPDAGEAEDHEDGPAETQEALWGPVVDHFAGHFTNTTGGARQWRQRLVGNPQQPYVTDEVARQLSTVDVRNVPSGHYESREIAQSGEYEIAVKVDYREGWSMVLYLISDGTHWQIHTYDKWVE